MGVNTVDVETPSHRKLARTPQEAVAGIKDGDLLLVGGWGGIGVPHELILATSKLPVRNLTLVSNNCGTGIAGDVGELFKAGLISKVITTFPVHTEAVDYLDRVKKGEVEVELTPQGTLAERLRCAGAGLGGFFTPTGVGTELGENKESRVINGNTAAWRWRAAPRPAARWHTRRGATAPSPSRLPGPPRRLGC